MPEIDPNWPQEKALWEKARHNYPCIGCRHPGAPGHRGRYYRAGAEVWGCVRCAIKWARYLKEFKRPPPPPHWRGGDGPCPDDPQAKGLLSGGHAYVDECPGCRTDCAAFHSGFGNPLYGFVDCLRCAVRLARLRGQAG